MIISSTANPTFKKWKDLGNSKGIREYGEFILMGEKLVHEFLKTSHFEIAAELKTEEMRPISSSSRTITLSEKMFDDIDILGTHYNLLVLKLKPQAQHSHFDSLGEPQGLEIIAPLGDPNNLGALVRSARGFGAKKLILTQESCHPFHPKALKASSGAALNLNIEYLNLKLSDLPETASQAHAYLDSQGKDISDFNFPTDFRFLVGEEGPGIPKHLRWQSLSIKTNGIESLNATVASSIALFSYHQRR